MAGTHVNLFQICSKFDNMNTDDIWYQQESATWHTAYGILDILQDRFEVVVISGGSNVNKPPRSCNLTPLAFFLWVLLSRRSLQISHSGPQSQHNPCYPSNSAWFVGQSQGKLDIFNEHFLKLKIYIIPCLKLQCYKQLDKHYFLKC